MDNTEICLLQPQECMCLLVCLFIDTVYAAVREQSVQLLFSFRCWDFGLELRLSGLAASTLLAEPSPLLRDILIPPPLMGIKIISEE